jgi:hypothetical protein
MRRGVTRRMEIMSQSRLLSSRSTTADSDGPY